jgi:CHAP domain
MSLPSFEAPQIPLYPEATIEGAEISRFQQALATVKMGLGRAALALGLVAGASLGTSVGEVANAPTAYADTGGYPDADAVDCSKTFGVYSWCKGNPAKWLSGRGYGYRNCTDWAAFRAPQLVDVDVPNNLGNAKDWNDNAPKNWSIDGTPEPGDIAESEAGTYGHVGVVEGVDKDSQGHITAIQVSQYNAAGAGEYSKQTFTPDGSGVFWRDSAKTKKWDNFLDLNGSGKGIHGESLHDVTPPPPDNTVFRVIKRTQSDGTNLVYWAKAGTVFESWWRPGGDGVHLTNVISITQQDIKDIDMELEQDGEHVLYTATSHNVWETWWYPGQGTHTSEIVKDAGNIRKIQKTVGPDGNQQLYVMTDQGVDEYWWQPWQEIHHSRIYTLANPVAMEKEVAADGTQELYVADQGYVYENWWRGDSDIHRDLITHIAQNDITSMDFSEDGDGKHLIYVGRSRDGVWEAAWYPGQDVQARQITGDNGVRAIQKCMDGSTHVLYVATAGGVYEYKWEPGGSTMPGSVITNQDDVHDIVRSTSADGAQAVYTAANTTVYESWWRPGSGGVHTAPIA